MSEYVDNMRIGIGESDRKRDEGLCTPADIERFDDIAYDTDKMQVLDVYRPVKFKDKKLPVIVSVHGGGWVYGDKECYQHYCMSLAQYGFSVVNFSYRLAPENKFPACLEDTCRVFAWLLENADSYGFDTENVFALGDSAGGHILSMFSCMCVNPELRRQFAFCSPKGFVPKAIALNCGVYDPFMINDDDNLTEHLLSEVMSDVNSDKEKYIMNVLNHISVGFPPSYIMTSNSDFLKKQATPLAERLAEVNTDFELRFFSPENTKLSHVFNCDIRNEYAQICTKEEIEFFRVHIK